MIFMKFFQSIITILIVFLGMTQVVIPLILNKPLFGLFRSKKPATPTSNLHERIEEVENVVEEAKKVVHGLQEEVSKEHEKISELKDRTDHML